MAIEIRIWQRCLKISMAHFTIHFDPDFHRVIYCNETVKYLKFMHVFSITICSEWNIEIFLLNCGEILWSIKVINDKLFFSFTNKEKIY